MGIKSIKKYHVTILYKRKFEINQNFMKNL